MFWTNKLEFCCFVSSSSGLQYLCYDILHEIRSLKFKSTKGNIEGQQPMKCMVNSSALPSCFVSQCRAVASLLMWGGSRKSLHKVIGKTWARRMKGIWAWRQGRWGRGEVMSDNRIMLYHSWWTPNFKEKPLLWKIWGGSGHPGTPPGYSPAMGAE